MSERFERLMTFGALPVNYTNPDTWTDEVKALYQRLEDGDCKALAPLLKWDIEFLSDSQSIRALVVLKFDPFLPGAEARKELRRIANVIQQRPRLTRSKLPYGDRLEAELQATVAWIEKHRLLEVKRDRKALEERLRVATKDFPPEARATICVDLLESLRPNERGFVRSSRSWALEALAERFNASRKEIEKRITRDIRSGRRRR